MINSLMTDNPGHFAAKTIIFKYGKYRRRGSGCDVTMIEMFANGIEDRKTLRLEIYPNGKGKVNMKTSFFI